MNIINSYSRSFDDLIFNPYYELARCSRVFTRVETMILRWLNAYPDGRSYPDLMWECGLSLEECFGAIEGLLELGVLRWR